LTRTNRVLSQFNYTKEINGVLVPQTGYIVSEDSAMVSTNHMPINTSVDDGGAWELRKSYDRCQVSTVNFSTYGNGYGETFPYVSGWEPYIVGSPPTAASIYAFGTSAIAKCAPVNPAFDMSTAFGEVMRDGLPAVVGATLLRDRAKHARSAGGEYLNYQFGWAPLLRDVRGFAKAVKNSSKILDQYRKDSDQKVRRRWEPPSDTRTKIQHENSVIGGFGFGAGPGTITGTYIDRKWFSGAFKYHIPVSDGVAGKFQQWSSYADHLLGVRVTPETLWNIAPWSWAVDWFTNTGDVITNISNLGRDGMVMQYGYAMHHKETRTVISGHFRQYNGVNVPFYREYGTIYKTRLPASPYGFGVSSSSLSAKQLAIIAALGLSRT